MKPLQVVLAPSQGAISACRMTILGRAARRTPTARCSAGSPITQRGPPKHRAGRHQAPTSYLPQPTETCRWFNEGRCKQTCCRYCHACSSCQGHHHPCCDCPSRHPGIIPHRSRSPIRPLQRAPASQAPPRSQ